MTEAQNTAYLALNDMRYKTKKTNDWDRKRTEDKCAEQPTNAIILHDQLEYRIEQRNQTLQAFYQLLKEAQTLADHNAGMYKGFRAGCIAKDLLNPTDAELDLMSVDEIIISGYARNWRAYMPDLSLQNAVCLALLNGCPHTELFTHLTNIPE